MKKQLLLGDRLFNRKDVTGRISSFNLGRLLSPLWPFHKGENQVYIVRQPSKAPQLGLHMRDEFEGFFVAQKAQDCKLPIHFEIIDSLQPLGWPHTWCPHLGSFPAPLARGLVPAYVKTMKHDASPRIFLGFGLDICSITLPFLHVPQTLLPRPAPGFFSNMPRSTPSLNFKHPIVFHYVLP